MKAPQFNAEPKQATIEPLSLKMNESMLSFTDWNEYWEKKLYAIMGVDIANGKDTTIYHSNNPKL